MSEQTSGSITGQDALQDFLQVVSHDLGEPLRLIYLVRFQIKKIHLHQ